MTKKASLIVSAAFFLLLFFMPATARADEAYTWTDSSGNTQTSGIGTTTTTYYGVNNTGSAAYYKNGSYQDGASNVSYEIVTATYSDKTTYVLSGSGTFTLTGDLQADIIVGPGSSGSTVDVTIDLNGYTLTGTGYSSVIIALAYSNVTICDSSSGGTGVITGGVGTYLDPAGVTSVDSSYGASTASHIYSESITGRAGAPSSLM